jgi:rusticyanin
MFKVKIIMLVVTMDIGKALSISAIILSLIAVIVSSLTLTIYQQKPVQQTTSSFMTFLNLSSNTNFTINENDLMYLMNFKPIYAEVFPENNTIRFTHDKIVIVVVAEPELGEEYEDRYVIFGLINPTLIVPVNASVTVIFINGGESEFHSFAIISTPPPYPENMESSEYNKIVFDGATTPNPLHGIQFEKPSGIYHGFVIQFTASRTGTYYYVCLVDGHAHDGMFGEFIVK